MKEYNVTFEITQLANSSLEAAKLVDETLKDQEELWIYTVQEMGTDNVISIDLLEEDNQQETDITKEYTPQIKGNNLFTESQMKEFAYNFYYDLSRKREVPENLISENFTLVEEYFKGIYNK